MSEIDTLIVERKKEIIQLQEGLGVEDINEIVELVKNYYNKLPTSRVFTPDKKFTRALSFVSADLAPQDGREKIELAILGYTRPRDWNNAESSKILADWEKGPVAQQKLIDDHKVMRIKTREGYKAVSKVEELENDDKGVPQVIKGKILEGDEPPIPRDHLTIGGKGEKTWENKHYGYPLGTKWAMNMHGLTHDGKKDILLRGNIYSNYDGDWATPSSDDFLIRKAPPFGFYDATVVVDDEKSTEDCLVIKSISAIVPKIIMVSEDETIVNDDGTTEIQLLDKPLDFLEYIYGVMEGTEIVDDEGNVSYYSPIKDFKEYLMTEDPDIRASLAESLFLVESNDYAEFHDLIANRDEEGKLKRTDKGANYSKFNKLGLSVMVCKQIKETKNGNDQLVLVGGGGKVLNAFMPPEYPKLSLDKSAECLISFNTVKKGTRYDKETKKQVKDPVNGDVQINNVMGYKTTFELMD